MSGVAVTGSAGRLGRSVVAVLRESGYDVTSIDRTIPDGETNGRAVDLTDGAEAAAVMAEVKPEAVIHLAAIAVPFSAPEDQILRTNVALAHNVFGSAIEAGARTVVTASSPTVFGYGSPSGWMPEALPLTESMQPRPWNAYSLSKMVAENVASMFAAKHGNALRCASFRPCYVIAPEEWHGAPTQQGNTVRQRLDEPELAASALFNYTDARDIGDFLGLLVERAHSIPNAETFIVGAADAMCREPLADVLPRFFPELTKLARPLTGSRPAFSSEKAERLLGWRAARSWRTELADKSDVLYTETAGETR
ncbi:NAD-dependent epimerase/dehydratase family protein [Paramicrobacterium chengjingii]|uniref:NAD-dependent epimerase/dehydratase family protein n=1 Tax=Paramicrobacterium chengjingii TaxID=2769067 RepID=UPI00141FBE12|nr:NAD(P)-dependent oxidoreductase [Microbacterium chengjingii]